MCDWVCGWVRGSLQALFLLGQRIFLSSIGAWKSSGSLLTCPHGHFSVPGSYELAWIRLMTSPGVSSNPSRCLPFKIREVKLHLRLNFSHNIASFFFLFRVSDFHSLGGPTLKETKKLKILTYGIVKNAQDDVDFHDWLFFSRGRCHGLEKPAAKAWQSLSTWSTSWWGGALLYYLESISYDWNSRVFRTVRNYNTFFEVKMKFERRKGLVVYSFSARGTPYFLLM